VADAVLTPEKWLTVTGWNARTLRRYPEKALKVMSEQTVRADILQAAVAQAPHAGDCAGWYPVDDDYRGEESDEHMNEDECDCWKAALP
jgi:hypothetical protein